MNAQALIGIDIGGTKIVIGKIVDGKIVQEIKFPTMPERAEKEIIDDIIHGVNQIFDQSVIGIGIGVPGLVDSDKGIIYNLTNIPSWKEVHLKENLEAKFHLPVHITNDANCFAVGEKFFGKGQPFPNLVGITLGTGLGTGIIANNKLLTGLFSIAGEVADIPYLDSNYEHYCSNKFFINVHKTTAKETYDKALKGDAKAIEIFNEFGNHLGNLTKTILLAYGPEAIIFGGSVSNAFSLFYPSLLQNLSEFPHKNVTEKLKIFNFTSNDIPLMGAAALSFRTINENNTSDIYTYEKK